MLDKILKHPTSIHADEITTICHPLSRLNINYFSHVRVDDNNQLSGISTHPDFNEHYLRKKYYNADIHMANNNPFGNYIIWDSIQRNGESEKLYREGIEFGIQNTFTIIQKEKDASHFYHFATDHAARAFNQVYLNNIDSLEMFILYFNEKVKQNKALTSAYDITFDIDPNAKGYEAVVDTRLLDVASCKPEFIQSVHIDAPKLELATDTALLHKYTRKQIALSPQQIKCLALLVSGCSAKQIANQLNLSPRTVNHYLEHIRNNLGYSNSKELIAAYYAHLANKNKI